MKRTAWKRAPYRLPALKRAGGPRRAWWCHRNLAVLRVIPPKYAPRTRRNRTARVPISYTTASYVAKFCSLNHLKRIEP